MLLSGAPLYAINVGGPTVSFNNVAWQSDLSVVAGLTTNFAAANASGPVTSTDSVDTTDASVSLTGRSYELLDQGALTLNPTDYTAPNTVFSSWRNDGVGGADIDYSFSVTPGKYRVDLYFVEPSQLSVGARVFDVKLEGATVLDDFDIYAETGGQDVAVGRSFVVDSNSQLNVTFVNQTGEALLNAIRIADASPDVDISFNPSTITAAGINQIQRGDVVEFQPGVYDLSSAEVTAILNNAGNHRQNVTLRGVPGQTIFDFSDQSNVEWFNFDKFVHGFSNHYDGLAIDGLTFLNAAVRARGHGYTIQNSIFDGYLGKTFTESDRIISVWQTNNATIKNNYVHWDNADKNINPIGSGETDNSYIGYNKLEGRLRRGIQFWKSNGGLVEFNDIERWAGTPGEGEGNAGPYGEDHGIYLHNDVQSGTSIQILSNTVRGWSNNASGGSLKIKDVSHIEVANNEFYRSGILGRGENATFAHIWIHDNNMYDAASKAISIWTPGTTPTAIRVNNNSLHGGTLTAQRDVTSAFNNTVNLGGGVTGGIYNNNGGVYDYAAVINDSGNTTSGATNTPPQAFLDSQSTDQGMAVVVGVLSNDKDTNPGTTLSVQSVTQGGNGSVVNNGDGTVTYTPNPGIAGSDSFTYIVGDGNGGTDTATVFIEVQSVLPVNTDPTAVDDNSSTSEGVAVVISVLSNDTDPDVGDMLSVLSVTQGGNGTVSNNGDGTVTYTPNANFGGADAFTYIVSDGKGGTDTATVNVTVRLDGDLNADGFVGIEDLNAVLSQWNLQVTPGSLLDGDPSGDGFVGIDDLNVVLGNWNSGSPPAAEGQAVTVLPVNVESDELVSAQVQEPVAEINEKNLVKQEPVVSRRQRSNPAISAASQQGDSGRIDREYLSALASLHSDHGRPMTNHMPPLQPYIHVADKSDGSPVKSWLGLWEPDSL